MTNLIFAHQLSALCEMLTHLLAADGIATTATGRCENGRCTVEIGIGAAAITPYTWGLIQTAAKIANLPFANITFNAGSQG